jgi:hypothetical protein
VVIQATGRPVAGRRDVDERGVAGPEKMLAFRKSLEDSRQVLYHFFAHEKAFKDERGRHLWAGPTSGRPTRRARPWCCLLEYL